jgi:hypothetical protein
VGTWTTPLIETIQLLVVWVEPRVKATVVPSPLNCSSSMTVNTGTPTAVPTDCCHILPMLLVVVLKRIMPVTPVAGRCAVLPTGVLIDVVVAKFTMALVTCVDVPKAGCACAGIHVEHVGQGVAIHCKVCVDV